MYMKTTALMAAICLLLDARQGPPPPPNILYIMTDQQHAGMMSCAGNRWLKTPSMDSLAADGVRFELAYAANPVCLPSRVTMMTGFYPSRFGIRSNQNPPEIPADVLGNSLGHLLRRAGYETAFGGKTHWPRKMTPERIGFEYITRDERDGLADACVEFLRRRHDRPFFLVASFINPHDICYMALDAWARAEGKPPPYPHSTVERQRLAEALAIPAGVTREEFFERLCPPLPANHEPPAGRPPAADRHGGFRAYVKKHWTAEDWRLHRWAYARLTERVDAEIGRVLTALRDAGLDRETVVVFSSDHGDLDGAHRLEHKSEAYEESARVPFIVSWKGRTPPGHVDRDHLVSAGADLLPTICDYAGVEAPKGIHGRSVRRLAEGSSVAGWRDDLAVECTDSRMIRTGRHKYVIFRGDDPREMLFDMEQDPGETRNLAADPALTETLRDLRRRLLREMEARGDRIGLEYAPPKD